MTDLVAAMTDAITKRLNGPTGVATVLLLLSIIVSTAVVFLRSHEAKVLPSLVRFMMPIDTLTHASARADFLFWISREFLMLLVAVPMGAAMTIACGYASHAALVVMFGAAGHVSDHQDVAISLLFTFTMLLAYGIMMDFVRHTHLKMSFGPLVNRVILCPHYHQLHYSINPKHFGKSFGLMLSVWDRMFGALHVPEPNGSFSFGLGSESRERQSTFRLYVLPFRKIGRLLRLERAEALLRAPAPVQFDTTQLGITSRQRDPVA